MTTTTASAPKPSFRKVAARRVALALVILILLLVPSLILVVLTKQPSATYAAMGGLIGIVAVVAGGTRIGVLTSIIVGLLAPICIVAGLSPVTGAALMAIMTIVVGRMSIFGLHRAVMLVPIMLVWPILSPVPWVPRAALHDVNELLTRFGLSLAEALDKVQSHTGGGGSGSTPDAITNALVHQRFDSTYLAWIAVFFLVGAIVPVIVLHFALRRFSVPQPQGHTRSEAVPYTITITVLTTVATYWFLDHPKQAAGSFMIATILVLAQVGNDIQWKLTIERVLGTLGGVIVLIGVMAAVGGPSYTEVLGLPMPLTLYALGLVFGAAAIIAKFSPRQWIYYILITPTAALLNAFSTTQARNFGEQRLIDNVIGSALVILAAGITLVTARIGHGGHVEAEPSGLQTPQT